MLLKINEPLIIDNMNQYPAEVVEQLEQLLASGVEARLDPGRKNFYQVDHTGRAFFFHAFPAGGKVMLLASWPVQPALALS
jgi:hypothetical protein